MAPLFSIMAYHYSIPPEQTARLTLGQVNGLIRALPDRLKETAELHGLGGR